MVLFKIKQNGCNGHHFMETACLAILLLSQTQLPNSNGLLLTNKTIKDAAIGVRIARQVQPPYLGQVCGGNLAVDPKNTTYIVSPLSDTTKVKCQWKIEAPFGKQIKFVFEFFQLKSTRPDCSDFYFEIKDVTGTQRYCHEGPTERSYVASGSVLEATYYSSDTRQAEDGLRVRLEYGSVPCQAFFNNVARGSIFTPGYPSTYPDDRICTWRMQVPPGYVLQLSCNRDYFWIENAPFCQNDVLLLSLTGRADFADALRFCGRRGPYQLLSLTNVITLLFKSNLYYHYRGFHCDFSAVPYSGGIIPTIPPTVVPPDPNSCGSCGVGNQPAVRVTGGSESVKNQFPWTVAILQSVRNNTAVAQFCGGTLLNDRYVLTAAHCLRGRTADMLRVDVGDHNLKDSTESRAIIVRVASVLVNPAYQSNPNNNVDNDIAILKLDRSLNFSQIARPVCLPSPGVFLDGMNAVVAGWGKTSSTSNNSAVLRVGTVQVLPMTSCAVYGQILTNNMICAGAPPGSTGTLTDACPGDSGGPLTVFLGGRWYLIGVVSSGPPNNQCGVPNWPGLYTRVGNYIPWIMSNTRIDSTCSAQRNFNADAQNDIAALAASPSSSQTAEASNFLQTSKPSNRPPFGAIGVVSDADELSLLNINKDSSQGFHMLAANRPLTSPSASVRPPNVQVTVTKKPTYPFWVNNQRPSFLQAITNTDLASPQMAMNSGIKPAVQTVAASDSLQTSIASNRPSFGAIVDVSNADELSLLNISNDSSQGFHLLAANRPLASVGPPNVQVIVTKKPTFPFWVNNQRPSFLQVITNTDLAPPKMAMNPGIRPAVNNVPSFIVQSTLNSASGIIIHNPPFMPFRARPPVSANTASSSYLPWKTKHNRYQEIDLR